MGEHLAHERRSLPLRYSLDEAPDTHIGQVKKLWAAPDSEVQLESDDDFARRNYAQGRLKGGAAVVEKTRGRLLVLGRIVLVRGDVDSCALVLAGDESAFPAAGVEVFDALSTGDEEVGAEALVLSPAFSLGFCASLGKGAGGTNSFKLILEEARFELIEPVDDGGDRVGFSCTGAERRESEDNEE